MNYRQLQAFRAVMDAGTVVGAADLLHISQPSVSAHIANLEHALKIQLFVRQGGRLTPTAEAYLLHEEAGHVARGMARLRRLAADIQQLQAGRLVIGAYPALSSIVLPRFIGAFSRRHPKLRLALMPASSVRIAELAASKQLDIGLMTMPAIDPATTCDLIFETASVCVLPAGHPLSDRDTIEASDIRDESFIQLGREDGSRQAVERSFDDAGVRVEARFDAHFSDSACALVAEGLGVSIVDKFSAERWRGTLVIKPFLPYVPSHVYLTRSRTHMSSLLQEQFEREFRIYLEESFS
ncbi:LysR substrate-binding domain-containing protein [Mesorhizobium humile]|uniref:LysR substrate-binding domain-containing protein n=1 Tax=Mesorhizobium humile TaxID=3072313 RepID=A0ABU4YPW8_9HYPH|nr:MULTISPECIES: LysR substrate-binding domain-containing protein [unclassified Mesorhizobium]MDX8457894.1 LysR substrate-binding domain-containing protein [Mesorhizobium sp. VK2D]MDX8487974.1 LysR substrate-binding domain-containing protein [Mesorhizobium sp. VK2B]